MINYESDLKDLYLAIGYTAINWTYIESAMDYTCSIVYHQLEGKKKLELSSMPKFTMDKSRFIRKAFTELPELANLKKKAIKLIDQVANTKDQRHDFMHSALTDFNLENGTYSFTRLDAVNDEHIETHWVFDAKKFPAFAKKLGDLANSAQSLASEVLELHQ